MSEGTAWKLVPLGRHPNAFQPSLDNGVIPLRLPEAVERWLAEPDPGHRLIASDVAPAHGAFAALRGPEPRNSDIRGLRRASTAPPPSRP